MDKLEGNLRVVVLAPIGRDAHAVAALLHKARIASVVVTDVTELIATIADGAGTAVVAEEALYGSDLQSLQAWIEQQPAWADIPFVILTSHHERRKIAVWRTKLSEALRNVSMLERPVQAIALTSHVEAALRARRRQYELQALMAARERTAAELEALVLARTQELETANAELQKQIVEREAVEVVLRQAQKMEAVGQLTGGLAHDFNNMLAGISGSLEMMSTRLQQGRTEGVDRYIDAALTACKRAANLTHRLLAFSRRQTLDPKPINVIGLIGGMDELIRRAIGPSITLNVAVSDEIWTTLADPNQLENAVLNLCINARDAMPDGGSITISPANTTLDEQDATDKGIPPGDYLCLSVTDTGTGMSPDVAARAFDPFFTTKPLGEGTGLGLSMIYGFARQSGGHVEIRSKLAEGTTICLYLPRHDEIGPSDGKAEAHTPNLAKGDGEVVLIIDDEPTIRMLVAEVLEDNGYKAVEASDGAAGLHILQSSAKIDLLITDVGLPGGLNGRQVADAARLRRPQLKVLFITGYAENAALGKGQLSPGMHVMLKPFEMDQLASKVSEIIKA